LVLDGADMFSSIWQPMLKSVGRWQLEVAGLGMKQGQAALQLSRDLSRCLTPGDIASANMRYWNAVTLQYSQSSQRLAASVARTVEAPIASEVVALPRKPRGHDVIELPNDEMARPAADERKVA
jgi:hypothetical protein